MAFQMISQILVTNEMIVKSVMLIHTTLTVLPVLELKEGICYHLYDHPPNFLPSCPSLKEKQNKKIMNDPCVNAKFLEQVRFATIENQCVTIFFSKAVDFSMV